MECGLRSGNLTLLKVFYWHHTVLITSIAPDRIQETSNKHFLTFSPVLTIRYKPIHAFTSCHLLMWFNWWDCTFCVCYTSCLWLECSTPEYTMLFPQWLELCSYWQYKKSTTTTTTTQRQWTEIHSNFGNLRMVAESPLIAHAAMDMKAVW